MSPYLFFTFTYWYLTVALYWPLCGFWTRQKLLYKESIIPQWWMYIPKFYCLSKMKMIRPYTDDIQTQSQGDLGARDFAQLYSATHTLFSPPTSVVRCEVCVHYVVLLYYIDPLLLWAISPLHEVKAKKYSAASKRNYSDYHSHMMQCSIFWACYIEFRKYANSADTNRKYLHV